MVKIKIDNSEIIEFPKKIKLTYLEEMTDKILFKCKTGCCFSCLIEVTSGIENIVSSPSLKLSKMKNENLRLACCCIAFDNIEIKTKGNINE